LLNVSRAKYVLRLTGAAVVLALVIVPSGVGLSPAQAASAVIDPVGPGMLDILPSTVAKSAASAPEILAALAYKFLRDPKMAASLAAKAAGTATTSQVADAAAVTANYGVPATAMGTAAKFAGGAGLAFSGFELGGAIGSFGTSLFMKDPNGVVCSSLGDDVTGHVVAFFAHQTCKTFGPSPELAAQVNYGVTSGFSSAVVCAPAGSPCYQITGTSSYTITSSDSSWGPQGSDIKGYCIKISGANLSPNQLFLKLSSGAVQKTDGYSIRGNGGGPYYWIRGDCANNEDSTVFTEGWPTSNAGPRLFISQLIATGPTSDPTQPDSVSVPVTSTSANPSRVLRCTISTTTGGTYSADSAAFTETDPVFAVPRCPTVPGDQVAAGVKLDEVTPDGSDVTYPLADQPTTPEYQAAQTQFPECSSGTCLLDLIKKGTSTSCFADSSSCADWYTDPTKNDDYQCKYGTHLVAITECTVYAPSFKSQNIATGNTLGDPTTGEQLASPDPTGTDPQTFGESVQDPAASRSCFPTGWGVLNPVEWVMKPVQCALQWAFVPKQSSLDDFQDGIQDKLDGTAVPAVFTAVNGLAAAFNNASSGCQGPAWTWQIHFGNQGSGAGTDSVTYPLSACEGTMASTAFWFRTLSTAFVWIFTLLACARYLASVFGMVGVGQAHPDTTTVRFKPEGSE
jgi:hypothetical protein